MNRLDAQLQLARNAESKRIAELDRRMSLDQADCYAEGYTEGYDDGREGYQASIRLRSEDYSHPDCYRDGYRDGWTNGDSQKNKHTGDDDNAR